MSVPLPIAVLLSGRGSNFKAIAEAFHSPDSPVRIVAVGSDNQTANGLLIAQDFKIPTVVVERQKDKLSNQQFHKKMAEALRPFAPKLIVLAGYMRIVDPQFINSFAGWVINIHPTLLPAFKGLAPHKQVLESGVCFSGCTVHLVNEKVDDGAIIAQAVVPVLPNDSEELLAERIIRVEHELYPEAIRAIALGTIQLEQLLTKKVPAPRAIAGADSHKLSSLGSSNE